MKPVFKPTSSSTGSALFTSFGPHKKDGSIVCFFEVKKQSNWDASRKIASFKNSDSAKVMLNGFELCGIIEAINTKTSYKTYHKLAGGAQSAISFDFVEGKGFQFKLFQANVNYLVGLSFAEARLLAISIEANLALDATQWINRQAGAPQEEIGYDENA